TEVPDKPETSDKSKLDKLLEGGNITLNCLIPGEEARDIFKVTISNANNNRVSSLAKAIRNCRLDQFRDINSTRLVLYKNKSEADRVIIQNLRNNNVAILDVECRSTGRILGVIEVKKEDFMKEFTQASVQMESTLTRKRKAEEIDNGQDVDRVFGIITDASEWYFMECTLDKDGKPSFAISKPVIVVYDDENLQTKVEKVLGHIVWLLEEAQKPVEASQSGQTYSRCPSQC
ncbi:2801_t:CDS:2, partial [Funneliformis caledonium]